MEMYGRRNGSGTDHMQQTEWIQPETQETGIEGIAFLTFGIVLTINSLLGF